MSRQPPDDRPMNEEEWERQFRESDVRSAKFGELLETLIDHPDCDEIIEREMGWVREVPEPLGDEEPASFDPAADPEDEAEIADAPSDDPESELDELEQMPAYARAYQFGLRVHNTLKPFCIPDQEDQDEDLIAALSAGFTIAAKLAGAHGMGYDDEALCGNIVCCKRSKAAAEQCLEGLRALRDRGV